MKIKNIIIVGGGSSGWMTAAYLSKTVPNINITLIESKNVPIIGVGESTLSSINRFLKSLGVLEQDWMPRCNAVYKTSIRFTDFYEKGKHYYQMLKPVRAPVEMNHINDFYYLCHQYPDQFNTFEFPKFFDDYYHMVDQNKYTFDSGPMNWCPNNEKAYHFDAYKFGLALKDLVAIPNGVNHIQDDIYAIRTDDIGITGLETKENGCLSADLYIDCSGFKSLLLEQALKVEYLDFTDKMINDRALATNVPYEDVRKELNSYTDCIAMPNGWIWNIPNWERIGTGYVYSSKFIDDESAEIEFRNKLKERYGDRANNLEFKKISFTPGVRKQPWYKNVVGVGLSCGFIEPLRSTGLLVTHEMLEKLAGILNNSDLNVKNFDRQFYNKNVIDLLKTARDWVSTHYSLSKRNDTPYWRYVTEDVDYEADSEYYNTLFDVLNFDTDIGIEDSPRKDSYYNKMLFNKTRLYRSLASGGYGSYTRVDYERDKKVNPNLYYRIERMRNDWVHRNRTIQQYISTLPNYYDFIKSTIYK